MPPRLIVFHGTLGSVSGNWFPWLRESLSEDNVEVTILSLPTPERQSLENWKAVFHRELGELKPNDILLGHSAGGTFAMRLLESAEYAIQHLILVAPPCDQIGIEEFDRLNSTFVNPSFDWQKIKQNARARDMFCSDNDPYVPREQFETIARALDIKTRWIPGGAHLNAEAGYWEFPAVLKLIRQGLQPEKPLN